MSDLYADLQLFTRLAERLSFTALARETRTSHTTIARRIGQLEAHFGVPLLHRSTRRLALTAEGERLLDHARRVVAEIATLEADLAGTMLVRGTVRVGVTTALGLHYAGRLAALTARHPELAVEFVLGDWQDSLAESGVDLALRVDDPTAGTRGQPLGEIARGLFAAPGYLARAGTPAGPDALPDHHCVAYGYGAIPAVWTVDGRAWQVRGPFRANSSEAVLRAATAELGIALLPRFQVAAALAAGQLAPVLPDAAIAPLHLSIGYRSEAVPQSQRVRAVAAFLEEGFPG
jgi:DNA-binding transcriptional LysR family regulator